MEPAQPKMKFTTTDQLRCVAYTIAFGALVILFGHTDPRTAAVLIGLGAAISSMWVHIIVIRRELHRLLEERSSQSTVA
jgi:hypothetical protein